MSKETTFAEDVTDAEVPRDTLRWAAQEVGYLARHEGLKGSVVTLKVRFCPCDTHTRSRTLPALTSDDGTILRAAWALFQAESWAGLPVRLIGLGLSGWEGSTGLQLDLFATDAPDPRPHEARLYATLDAIRQRFDTRCIQRGLNRRK